MVDSKVAANADAPYTLRMAKVLADPLRIKIVLELYTRDMSPKQFFEEFGGGSVSRVSRHFDVLVEYGWLKLVETKSGGRRRGAVEHFYRATRPALFDNSTWPDLPDAIKDLFTWKVFETYAERVKEAVEAGTIDAREDRHFTWTGFLLDQRGWTEMIQRVDGLFYAAFEIANEADHRMKETGEEPILMTVALAAFESPKDSAKAP